MVKTIQEMTSEKRSHLLLTALSKKSSDSIYFIDREGRFIWVNATKARNSGTTIPEMIGKTDFDFMSEEEAERSWEDNQRVIDTKEPIVNKVEIITRSDKSSVFVSVTKAPWYDDEEEIIGVIGISRDITFVRNLIRLMVHDIRGPIVSMGVTMKLASRGTYGWINKSVKSTLKDLLHRADCLEKILGDYLSEDVLADYEIPPKEKLDLRVDVIDKILKEFTLEIERQEIKIDSSMGSIPKGEVIIAESNLNYLTIICRNLLQNFLRFVPKSGTIAIGFEKMDGFIKVVFWNNGPAVPFEKKESIFSEGDSVNSTGVGLSMCRELVEKLGGKIWYENRDWHPTFIFTIPR